MSSLRASRIRIDVCKARDFLVTADAADRCAEAIYRNPALPDLWKCTPATGANGDTAETKGKCLARGTTANGLLRSGSKSRLHFDSKIDHLSSCYMLVHSLARQIAVC